MSCDSDKNILPDWELPFCLSRLQMTVKLIHKIRLQATPARLRTWQRSLRMLVPTSSSTARFHSPFATSISSRGTQSLAPQTAKTPVAPQPPPPPPGANSDNPTQAEQRKQDWKIIWRLMGNVWPKNDWNTRGRVLFGLGLLVGGKVRG